MNGRVFLSRRAQFARTARIGKKISEGGWQLRYAPNRNRAARLGVVVPKRIVRLAVRRNRLRRMAREHFRQQWRDKLPAADMILSLLAPPKNADEAKLECARLFAKISETT
ncbi:MAG: ribonuclease P protein component [Gammaproteobacteria bacterium]